MKVILPLFFVFFSVQFLGQTSVSISDATEKCVVNNGDTESWVLPITAIGATIVPGSIQIEFDLYHSWKSDVTITLESPSATVVTIKTGGNGGGDDFGDATGSTYGFPATYTIADGLGGGNLDAPGDSGPGSYDPTNPFAAFNGEIAH